MAIPTIGWAQNQFSCEVAHPNIVMAQERLLNAKRILDDVSNDLPLAYLDTIVGHEQALQKKYAAELALFQTVAGQYSNPDKAFYNIKNFLLSISSKESFNCQRNQRSVYRTPTELWQAFQKNPQQFGNLKQTNGSNKDTASRRMQQFQVIRTFLEADQDAEQQTFERFRAEKNLAERLNFNSQQEQDIRQAIQADNTIENFKDLAPRCFKGAKDPQDANQTIINAVERSVSFDVYPVVKGAVCKLGVKDANWLAGNNLQNLQQRLEAATKVEPDADSQLWAQQNVNISLYQNLLSTELYKARRLQDPVARQNRLNDLEAKLERSLQLHSYLQSQKPASLLRLEENQQRLYEFDKLVDNTGLQRLSRHYNINDTGRLQELKRAERQYGKRFVKQPKGISTGYATPSYLQGLLDYSRFYEENIRQLINMLERNKTPSTFQALSCAIDRSIEKNFQSIKPACLTPTDAIRLNTMLNSYRLEKQ